MKELGPRSRADELSGSAAIRRNPPLDRAERRRRAASQVNQCQFFCYEGPQANVLVLGAAAVADSDELRIEARVENRAGGLVGAAGFVSPTGQVDPRRPSAARSGSGFVAAWEASNAETGLSEVWAQALSALGVPLSGSFQVAATETTDYSHPAIGGDGKGRLFVFYESRNLDEDTAQLIGRWFLPNGEKDSDELLVATAEGSTPLAPRLACEPWAFCWVLWHEGESEGRGTRLLAARIADDGSLLDEKPIAVRELDQGVAMSLDAWVETSGTATLVWEEFSEALVSLGVFHRQFDRNGIPLGDPQSGW